MKPLEPQHSHEHPPSGIVAWSPKGCLEAGAADLWIVEIENLSLGGWEVGRPWVYLNLTTIRLFCFAQESWTENRNFLYGFVCFFFLMWTFENPIKPLLLIQEEASWLELLQLCNVASLSPDFLESFFSRCVSLLSFFSQKIPTETSQTFRVYFHAKWKLAKNNSSSPFPSSSFCDPVQYKATVSLHWLGMSGWRQIPRPIPTSNPP